MCMHLENLSIFFQKLDGAEDTNQIFRLFAQEVLPLTGFDYCGLYGADHQRDALILMRSKKTAPLVPPESEALAQYGLARKMLEGQSFFRFYRKQESGYGFCEQYPGKGWNLLAGIPVMRKGQLNAAIVLASEKFSSIPSEIPPLLQIICRQLGAKIAAENGLDCKDSRKKGKILVDHTGEGIIETDLTGNIRNANQRAAQILRLTRKNQLKGKNVMDFFQIPLEKVISKGGMTVFVDLVTPDQNLISVKISSMLVHAKHDSIIQWFLSDTTDYKKNNKRLEKNLLFAQGIAFFATRFINSRQGEVDTLIHDILKQAGEFAQVDRSHIFQICPDGKHMDNTHEWTAEGIASQKDILQNQPCQSFPWWFRKLTDHQPIIVPDIQDLPPEASAEKEILRLQNIISVCAVPLQKNGTLHGFLGFDSVKKGKRWDRETVNLLQIIGEIIINALQKKAMLEKLGQSQENQETFFHTVEDFMLVMDIQGKLLHVNDICLKKLGYSKKELIGKPYLCLHPKNMHQETEELLELVQQGRKNICKVPFVTKSGKHIPVETKVSLGKWWGKDALFCVSRDNTRHLKNIKLLKRVAVEKQTLLKEVNHRVKNNLQLMISLLNLQMEEVCHEDRCFEILHKTKNRIMLMAAMHEKLYHSHNFANIDFGEYIRVILDNLLSFYTEQHQQIRIQTDIHNIYLNIATAIPVSLIINELVSNCFSHAFADQDHGTVEVIMSTSNHIDYNLTIRDNGIGVPQGIDLSNAQSLGFQLVADLTRQLSGSIRYDGSRGTSFFIKFKRI